ncbi:MAG TPA: amino acid permease [Candidatus Baltobacteraceae bacterium]|jgi:APA family basic amino acid/polyamine antiporter|nr:amino acid permease [Candidatus Baltobacteraceae bacterium]
MVFQRVKPLATILAEGSNQEHGLRRSLGPWALTAMGIGAIIGTGIFVLTGVASATRAGPSITISFVVAGFVSALAALCYAEVSSKIPISGSAYTYTYATMGEFLAWVIGWDLVLEYALGAATVSIGWSGYFANILSQIGLSIPPQWANGPHWGLAGQAGVSGYANLPAAGIILIITALLARGTRESGTVNAVIVAIKLLIVLFFIAVGVGHINQANYHLPPGPQTGLGGYFPFGVAGMLGGAAFIFFAYIGFDAVSTTAEEAKNPGRDLPFGIIMSLLICTILYIVVVAILNGMVPFYKLNVAFPVAFAMNYVNLGWASLIISLGAIAGLTTVLLVMMFGQSRIFFAMSRDGLIPPSFTRIHPTWRTPIFSTVFFGLCIAAIAAFTPINIVGSLTNMGTLVAFVLVSIAVPILRRRHPDLTGAFTVPFGPYLIPVLSAITALGLIYYLKIGNPVVYGIPIVWFWFVVWLIIGLIFYFAYGRNKSTVALQEAEGIAATQPRVN